VFRRNFANIVMTTVVTVKVARLWSLDFVTTKSDTFCFVAGDKFRFYFHISTVKSIL